GPGRDGEPRETSVLPVIQSETPFCPARYLRLALVRLDPGKLPRLENGEKAGTEARVFSPEQRQQLGLSGMLERHVRERVRRRLEEERRAWDAVGTRADWERFREPAPRAPAAPIGQSPTGTPLQTRVTKEYAGDGYRRQDLIYQSRPGLWVTANLYLPAQSRGRMPGIVIVHSHHRPRTQAELQDMGILWARAGSAVLIPDQIGAGERLQNYP